MKKILAILITPIFLVSCGLSKVEEWDESKKVWVYIGNCDICDNTGGFILLSDGTRYAPRGKHRLVRVE